jgi:hypothetical protein
VVVFLWLAATSDAAQKRVVTDLNHVTTITSEKKAERLYNGLRSLGLPSAWKFAEYGPISSGGIRIGNLNVELGSGITPKAGNQFATFEPPSLKGLTARLDARGIKHGKPIPTKAGSQLLYTRVVLPSYSQVDRLTVQFCAYAFPTGKPTVKAPANRAGLVNVPRVVLNTKRPNSWAKLFAPVKPRGNTYRLPSGPLVQLNKSKANSIARLDLRVKSVSRAARELRAVGIPVNGGVARLGSLRLRLLTPVG